MTLANLAAMLFATFLFALGLVLLIPHPARLLVNAAARTALLPIVWASVIVAAFGIWFTLRLHG
jgi:hypothetical protein